MSTITAVLVPDPDGSLHLPLPEEFRHGKVKVVATLDSVADVTEPRPASRRKAGSLKGKIWLAADFDEPLEDFKEL